MSDPTSKIRELNGRLLATLVGGAVPLRMASHRLARAFGRILG
jgi:hypothetical protein